MTKNVTMAIDEDLLKKARKIAVDKNTTLSGLFRNYLNEMVEQEEKNKNAIIAELQNLYDHSNAETGEITWCRDDLHER